MRLHIEHHTTYRYSKPVRFGPHRLLLRPREGHDVQIKESSLQISPTHRIRWVHDVFDNSVAEVQFLNESTELRIQSTLTLWQNNFDPFDFVLEPYASVLPFQYDEALSNDIMPYFKRHAPQDDEALKNWVRPYLNTKGQASTLDFLTAINRSVPMFFQYQQREEPGIQSPGETLQKRSGSCRDFALLMMEAARYLGLAARFVSGYLCETHAGPQFEAASGATHAWTEIYLPGAGWKGFDPTCGILAATHHVRVASARDPAQASPISGAFIGTASTQQSLEVEVRAVALDDPSATQSQQSS